MKKLIGSVAVDSGQLMITDPCYLSRWKNNEVEDLEQKEIDNSYSYNGACHTTFKREDQGGELEDGLAVAFSSGYGDGTYPVFAEYDHNNRIEKITIELGDN